MQSPGPTVERQSDELGVVIPGLFRPIRTGRSRGRRGQRQFHSDHMQR
eukprot:SAG31_NODE_2019_length_6660_cov_2.597775_2_plen_48_part_00